MGGAAGGLAGAVETVHELDAALFDAGAQAEGVVLDVRHRLRAAGYDEASGSGGDLRRGVQHRLQARAAAAVDLQARHPRAQTGVECGHAADRRCFAVGVAVAEDHVVDVALSEPGPADEFLQRHGCQLGGRERGERAAHAAHRGAQQLADNDSRACGHVVHGKAASGYSEVSISDRLRV